LSAAKAANASVKFSYRPVALFVGGTSGIGRATVEAFARYTKGDAHIIIIGQNEAAATEVLSSLYKSPSSTYEFLPCNATLMSNVSAACKSLTSNSTSSSAGSRPLTKLNFLFMTPGILSTRGFTPTSEGIDRKLSLNFYTRFKFAMELAPLLEAAADAGEDARVISVLAPGTGRKIDAQDLGLKKSYTLIRAASMASTANDLMVQEFSERHPKLSFTHIHPGFVLTSFGDASIFMRMIKPLLRLLLTSPQDCAEFMLRALFDPAAAKGAFHRNNHAELMDPSKLPISPEDQKLVYDHLV
ncbi:hypothetical protein BS47DRAFT_1262634, partial [Hydnum rufescens UP504]